MANELRMLLLTLVVCFSLMLTGISQPGVEAVTQRAAPVTVGEQAPDFTLEDQCRGRDSNPHGITPNGF